MVSLHSVSMPTIKELNHAAGCLVKPDDDSENSESESEEEEVEKKSTDPSIPWALEKDAKGWPVMPAEIPASFRLQKDIFRSFMTMTYREFFYISVIANLMIIIGKTTCNSKVRVPWDEISNDQSKYLSSEYVPDGVKIREPSRMHRDDIEKLLGAFLRRQQRNQKLLRYETVVLSDKRFGSSKFMFSLSDSDDEKMNLITPSPRTPLPPTRSRPVPSLKKVKAEEKQMKRKQKKMLSDSDSDDSDKYENLFFSYK